MVECDLSFRTYKRISQQQRLVWFTTISFRFVVWQTASIHENMRDSTALEDDLGVRAIMHLYDHLTAALSSAWVSF
jgi:hypothetical protein